MSISAVARKYGLHPNQLFTWRRLMHGEKHHTGDMGRFDEYGYLWYAGRLRGKELIKPGCENVYPV